MLPSINQLTSSPNNTIFNGSGKQKKIILAYKESSYDVNRFTKLKCHYTMIPTIINGHCHSDPRGFLLYNNDFDASAVKRFYTIENHNVDLVRAWQGHKIEQRWFVVVQGSFKIKLVEIDDWANPSKELKPRKFILNSQKMDVLYVPNGYASSIQSMEQESKLLVMADYLLGEVNDEYRFAGDYFLAAEKEVVER